MVISPIIGCQSAACTLSQALGAGWKEVGGAPRDHLPAATHLPAAAPRRRRIREPSTHRVLPAGVAGRPERSPGSGPRAIAVRKGSMFIRERRCPAVGLRVVATLRADLAWKIHARNSDDLIQDHGWILTMRTHNSPGEFPQIHLGSASNRRARGRSATFLNTPN